mmetsp:Transcript_10087/g.22106  ORF Transcript_10087/g.22106 Transcript_10087/m.22106 type:complete len:210 (-) Transcript_10087:1063-1692(-)
MHVHPKTGQQGGQSFGVRSGGHNARHEGGVQTRVGHLRCGFGHGDIPLLTKGIVQCLFGFLSTRPKFVQALGLGLGNAGRIAETVQTIGKVVQVESVLNDIVLKALDIQRPVHHGDKEGMLLRDGNDFLGGVPKGLSRHDVCLCVAVAAAAATFSVIQQLSQIKTRLPIQYQLDQAATQRKNVHGRRQACVRSGSAQTVVAATLGQSCR